MLKKFLNKFFRAGYLLLINPSLFLKYLKARIKRISPQWLSTKSPANSQKKIGDLFFDFDFQYLGWNLYTKQMYFDCYEIATVEFMKKALRPGDIFIDIGANIGYLTAVGAGLVGKSGQVHSFEPVPECFKRLEKLALMNSNYKIIINRCALGENSGMTKMVTTTSAEAGGSTMISGVLKSGAPRKIIKVPVVRLDDYLLQNKLEKISLIKIDVEGFEFPVLKGLSSYFGRTEYRPIIVCEIVPSAYSPLGYSREQLIDYMRQYGYEAYNIMNPKLKIDITKFKEGENVVFKTSKQ